MFISINHLISGFGFVFNTVSSIELKSKEHIFLFFLKNLIRAGTVDFHIEELNKGRDSYGRGQIEFTSIFCFIVLVFDFHIFQEL